MRCSKEGAYCHECPVEGLEGCPFQAAPRPSARAEGALSADDMGRDGMVTDPVFADGCVTIYCGDAWELAPMLAPQSIHAIVTSPPYWGLRDYGHDGQFGLEATPEEYVARLVSLFALLRPALRDDGTVWLILGDCFCWQGGAREYGLKPKDLVGIPWRVAFALQSDGWYLRSDIIWHKSNPMPESVTDRPTRAHEYVFLFAKKSRYYYDAEAIKEPGSRGRLGDQTVVMDQVGVVPRVKRKTRAERGLPDKQRGHSRRHAGFNDRWDSMSLDEQCRSRNKRSVWTVATKRFAGAHYATFPPELIKPCILAGCPEGGTVLDPFIGSGTTAQVARAAGRKCIGFEVVRANIEMAVNERGLSQGVLL